MALSPVMTDSRNSRIELDPVSPPRNSAAACNDPATSLSRNVAQSIKLIVPDAVEVLEHAGQKIPRHRGLASFVVGIQERLRDQVRLEVEDVETVDRLVFPALTFESGGGSGIFRCRRIPAIASGSAG
jgi:hypothetical protein